jgi:hypothetical protein
MGDPGLWFMKAAAHDPLAMGRASEPMKKRARLVQMAEEVPRGSARDARTSHARQRPERTPKDRASHLRDGLLRMRRMRAKRGQANRPPMAVKNTRLRGA